MWHFQCENIKWENKKQQQQQKQYLETFYQTKYFLKYKLQTQNFIISRTSL